MSPSRKTLVSPRTLWLPLLAVLALCSCDQPTEDEDFLFNQAVVPPAGEEAIDWSDMPMGESTPEVEGPYAPARTMEAWVKRTCSTDVAYGLSVQLIQELRCLEGIDQLVEVTELQTPSRAVFPWMQRSAAEAVRASVEDLGRDLQATSVFRTLAQQFLLHRWGQLRRCKITLAAPPGSSNHASGLSLDISDQTRWRRTLESNGFRWFGSRDKVHFDFQDDEHDLNHDAVLAFQRLWNRANPSDKIDENGDYDSATARRLGRTPSNGFDPKFLCDPHAELTTQDASIEADASIDASNG